MKRLGWRYESARHSLAARGVKTNYLASKSQKEYDAYVREIEFWKGDRPDIAFTAAKNAAAIEKEDPDVKKRKVVAEVASSLPPEYYAKKDAYAALLKSEFDEVERELAAGYDEDEQGRDLRKRREALYVKMYDAAVKSGEIKEGDEFMAKKGKYPDSYLDPDSYLGSLGTPEERVEGVMSHELTLLGEAHVADRKERLDENKYAIDVPRGGKSHGPWVWNEADQRYYFDEEKKKELDRADNREAIRQSGWSQNERQIMKEAEEKSKQDIDDRIKRLEIDLETKRFDESVPKEVIHEWIENRKSRIEELKKVRDV